MAEMNEEELHEKIEEYRKEVLRYIPLSYDHMRQQIQEAGSLMLIFQGVDKFLDACSAKVSVHRVFQRNLMPVRDRIEAELKELVIIEDERE